MTKLKKEYAQKHYSFYPKGDIPIYLAYGFRPIFLLLAPYIVISIILWAFTFSGIINLPIKNLLTWHMYEMIFGVGIAGVIAFFLTGVPEMFVGTIPIVGRKLFFIVALWLVCRISFWFIDFFGVYFVVFLNISLTIWIITLIIKPIFQDKNKRHISLAFALFAILFIQILFFLSIADILAIDAYSILLLSIGFFIVLIFLALRRITMESINELLETQNIDETFYSKAPRYNLAIFCLIIYTIIEFLFPNNSTLAYLALACFASILNILNDFILKDNNILFKPFIIYLMSIFIITAFGYLFLAYDYLNDEIYGINHFRHFLTTGTFGLVFYIVMIIISTIHTGRKIFTNIWLNLGVILIIMATLIRSLIPFYEEYLIQAYILSSILWAFAFIIYMKIFFPFLLSKRADGIKG
ncbi:NnrS family protein [Aliarcobacter butzleri]|uniref:NnrS family protein n=1 Tax=Aliarcobacter butzleri TaxID=28197 RepID=UPI00263E14A3|nr:NnrS family protein [Aliarcobacter butzleri]MDN5103133.1 NnrS family protein [Aliarcobacter butzleri]